MYNIYKMANLFFFLWTNPLTQNFEGYPHRCVTLKFRFMITNDYMETFPNVSYVKRYILKNRLLGTRIKKKYRSKRCDIHAMILINNAMKRQLGT